jgi:hypothetical protein
VAAGPQFDNNTVPFLTEFDELSVILLGNMKSSRILKIPQKFTSWIASLLKRWPFNKESNSCHPKSNLFHLTNVKMLQPLGISLEVTLWAIVA